MQWLQAIYTFRPQHKYAINSKMLGDDRQIAWSNLGYWIRPHCSYPQACQGLAERLADSVNLTSNDRVLDLGCGQGASLLLWKDKYRVQHIEAVELQPECVAQIQQNLKAIAHVRCDSFLNLKENDFEFKFDVILCVDAAYHCAIDSFLNVISRFLNSNGRVAFHSLMLSDKFHSLNSFKKLKYTALLKCADIKLSSLKTKQETMMLFEQANYKSIRIENLSEPVLMGFSNYIQQQKKAKPQINACGSEGHRLDQFKIEMTAALCHKLAVEGYIEYIQISAEKQE